MRFSVFKIEKPIYFLQLFAFALLIAISTLAINEWAKPIELQLATVDLARITTEFVKAEQQKHPNEAVLAQDMKLFGERLELALKRFAASHHLVLVAKEVLIAGAYDYTANIEKIIKNDSLRTQS